MTDAPSGSSPTAGRRGGPPAWFALLGLGGLVLGAAILVLQATGIGVRGPVPSSAAPAGAAAAATRDRVVAALERAALQVREPQAPYRPGESPALAAAARRLLQVVLPGDPQGGYIVIYELPDAREADRAGRELLAYLASGTGAIQYPRDARFVLRRVGSTLVFFPWSPEADPDPRVPEVAAALETVGSPVRPGD